ncbi:MAG: ankyrin repeat domain-containing protein [Alphaproteobacteria bacterium]
MRFVDELLHKAAAEGEDLELKRALQNTNGDPRLADENGITPLMQAAKGGHTNCITHLLDFGADIHARDKQGRTALYHAAENGRAGAVQLLMEKGGSPIVRDNVNKTPLHAACDKGDLATVETLATYKYLIDYLGPEDRTPLMQAAIAGHAEVVKLLAAKGADLKATCSAGMSAADYAHICGNREAEIALESLSVTSVFAGGVTKRMKVRAPIQLKKK